MTALGILVMGQAPRPEVERAFQAILPDVTLDLRGCLDGLTRDDIGALEPDEAAPALFTRLPSGEGVTLCKAAVERHGTERLAALRASGAAAVIVLCTGNFPVWAAPGVLFPSALLRSTVMAVQPTGHLGILVPLASQAPEAEVRWGGAGHRVTAVTLSPNATKAEAAAAGAALRQAAPDLLVFDCVSYTRQTKHAVTAAAGCAGILAVTAVARIAAELLDRG